MEKNKLVEYVNDYKSLLEKVSEYNGTSSYIFRGQTQNYQTDDFPYSFLESFNRKPCIPPLLFKWNYYCLTALKEMIGPDNLMLMNEKETILYTDALLQHYGWRSMQLDLSSNFVVSLFFAGYQYEMKREFQIVEDCYETGIAELVDMASYKVSKNEIGYLYVFDRKTLETNKDATFIDLTDLDFENIRPHRQKGCVLSSYPKPINEITNPAIVKVLIIKTDLITKYCNENEINQQYLFPTDTDDIYKFLITLPRISIEPEMNKSFFFIKELNIPDYSIKFNRFKNYDVAYYKSFWIFDDINVKHKFKLLHKFSYYKCKCNLYHLPITKNSNTMPELIKFIRRNKEFIIEFDNLYRRTVSGDGKYLKAIRYSIKKNIICVSEIAVKYVGKVLLEVFELLSRYYEIYENDVIAIRKDGDCPCDNDDLHLHNLMIGKYFTKMVSDGSLIVSQDDDKVYLVEFYK